MAEILDRPTARMRGLKTYFTGRECVNGHVAPRYVSTGGCVECLCVGTPREYRPHTGEVWTRERAIASGFSVYFTGTPCIHGHLSQRGTATGRCNECERLRMRAYRQSTKERERAVLKKATHIYSGHVVSKVAAGRQGLRRYFSGVVCEFGHMAERYVKNDQCVVCANLRQGAKK
jgi:hypothetical protein